MSTESNAYLRKQRREGILLAIVSAIFVTLGALGHYVPGGPKVTLVGVPLFGAGMLVGIVRAVRPGRGLSSVLAIVCCLAMGASGAMIIAFHLQGAEVFRSFRKPREVPVGILLAVFFGGGSILLLIRRVLRRLSRR